MHDKGLNRIEFAEKIGAQRSTLSHILDGRNRPSLDFLEKLTATYPGLNMNWLIKGEGTMFKKMEQTSLFSMETGLNPAPVQAEVYSHESIENSEKSANSERDMLNSDNPNISETETIESMPKVPEESEFHYESPSQLLKNTPENIPQTEKIIEKIIVFYTDKTFELYNPR